MQPSNQTCRSDELPSPDIGRGVGGEGRTSIAVFEYARDRCGFAVVKMYTSPRDTLTFDR